MPLGADEFSALAERLWRAGSDRRPCEPLTDDFPALTVAEAYRISKLNLERRLKERRERLVGRKIGLTSAAVQKQLGVDQPDFGYLTSGMQVRDGAALASGSLLQ